MATSPRSWTRRTFEATGLPIAVAGVLLFALGCGVFALQELALGRFSGLDTQPERLADMRISLLHIGITAYLLAAFAYYEQVRDAVTGDLADLLPAQSASPPAYGKILAVAGLFGVGIATFTALYLSPGPSSYDPASWTAETGWHRVLGLVMGFAMTRLFVLVVSESGRFSDLAAELPEIDLLAPEQLTPFVRLGMTGALLAIGAVAAFALFLVDIGYLSLVVFLLAASLLVGGLALFLPLRGVRERIGEAKQNELRWCRERIRSGRAALAAGHASADLAATLAWEARVRAVPDWPIDSSTLVRFVLYLLIPLGSWAGGAVVERAIDALLD